MIALLPPPGASPPPRSSLPSIALAAKWATDVPALCRVARLHVAKTSQERALTGKITLGKRLPPEKSVGAGPS